MTEETPVSLQPFERNKIHCGESEKLLAQLPDDCIDMTCTSPPYDNLRTYNGFTLDWHEIIRQLYRVTKPGGVVVWVVADQTINGSETGTSFRQALWAMECGFRLHDTMIYESPSNIPTRDRYYATFEYMFVFSKGKPKAMNFLCDSPNLYAGQKKKRQTKIGGENKSNGVGYYTYADMARRDNVWRYSIGKGHNDDLSFNHPAVFPEALARDHILSWSNPGDLVLDPFIGSGTTAKMAMQNGRHYLGFDISQEYVELARKRVAWANPPLLVVD